MISQTEFNQVLIEINKILTRLDKRITQLEKQATPPRTTTRKKSASDS